MKLNELHLTPTDKWVLKYPQVYINNYAAIIAGKYDRLPAGLNKALHDRGGRSAALDQLNIGVIKFVLETLFSEYTFSELDGTKASPIRRDVESGVEDVIRILKDTSLCRPYLEFMGYEWADRLAMFTLFQNLIDALVEAVPDWPWGELINHPHMRMSGAPAKLREWSERHMST